MSLVSSGSSNINVSNNYSGPSSNYGGGVIGSSSSNVSVVNGNFLNNYGSNKVIEEVNFSELFNQGNSVSPEVQECIDRIVNNMKYLGNDRDAEIFLNNVFDLNGNVDLDSARTLLNSSDYADLAYVVNKVNSEKSYYNDVQKTIIDIYENMKYLGNDRDAEIFINNVFDADGNVDLDSAKTLLSVSDYGNLAYAVEKSTVSDSKLYDVQNCIDKIVNNMRYLGNDRDAEIFLNNIYDAYGNVDLDSARILLNSSDYADLVYVVQQSQMNVFYEMFEKQQVSQIEAELNAFNETRKSLMLEKQRLVNIRDYFESELDKLSAEELGLIQEAPYIGSDVSMGNDKTHHYMTPEEYRKYYEPFKYDVTLETQGMTREQMEAYFESQVSEYEKQYCNLFYKINNVEYAQFVEDWNIVNSDIAILDASLYSLKQQKKEIPYIELTWTAEYKKFMQNRPNLETVEEELDFYFLTSGLLKNSWDYLSEEDKYKYYYLIKTSNEEEAYIRGNEFLEAIQDKVNNAKGMEEATKFIESIGQSGLVDSELWKKYINGESLTDDEMNKLKSQLNDKGFTNWIDSAWKTWWKGLEDGVDNFFEGIGNVFATEGMKSANQYAQMYILGMIGDSFLGHEYQIATSVGNMVPAMAVSAVVGIFSRTVASYVGSTLMGLSSGGNAKNQALIEGHSLWSSTLYGAGVGLSETSLGLLLGNIPLLNANAQFALSEIMSEGVEEFLQTYVDGALRVTFLGQTVDFSQMSEEAVMAFMYGIITSGGMTGGQAVFNFTWNGVTVAANNLDSVTKFKSFCKENNVQVIKDASGNNVLSVNDDVVLSTSKLKLLIEYFPHMKIVGESGKVIMESQKSSVSSKGVVSETKVNTETQVVEDYTNISGQVETVVTQDNNESSIVTEHMTDGEYYNSIISQANYYASKGNFYSVKIDNFSDIPSDFWSKINDPSQLFFVKDGKTFSFADAKALSEIDMSIDSVQTELGNVDYGKSNPVTYAIEYLKSNLRKYLYKDTSAFAGLNEQITQNGLYHFTGAADAILSSGYIKSSNRSDSYGNKKTFFFNGIPEVGSFAINLGSIPLKTTAVKVDATTELVSDSKLRVRYADDQAITYDGKFDLNGYNAEKCFFVLTVEDGKLVYKQVSEEVYNNYESTNVGMSLSEYISDKSNVAAIKNDYLSGISLRNTGGTVVDSSDVISVMDDSNTTITNESVQPNSDSKVQFDSIQGIAQYFGDSKLYLSCLLHEKSKDMKLTIPDLKEWNVGIYYGETEAINNILKYLTPNELAEYRRILNNEINSLQNKWISCLSDIEKTAIREYAENFGSIDSLDAEDYYGYVDSKGRSYIPINDLIRAGVMNGNPNIDSAIEKFGVLSNEIVTYRGVGIDALISQFGDIDRNNLSSLVGKTYSDKGYMSTSLLEKKAHSALSRRTDVILKITVPTDANYGAYIESISNLGYNQLEFLIKRDSSSVIENAYLDENGRIVLEMKLFTSDNASSSNLNSDSAGDLNTDDMERINSLCSSTVYGIVNDEEFMSKYGKQVIEKIIQNQDDIFLSDWLFSVCSKIVPLLGDDVGFYRALSDDNLIRMFKNDISNQMCLNEIINRVNNGSHLFSRYTLTDKTVVEIKDTVTAFSKLSEDMQKKVKELAREDFSYIPEDMRAYDYGGTFFGQCLLGKMIREGSIDEQGLNIVRELNAINPNIIKSFNFELLNKNILNKLGKDYIMEIGVYDKFSSRIVALSKNEKVFDAFVNIVNNSKSDDSLSTFYTKTECCLNYLLENINNLDDYSISEISSDEFINYMLFTKNHGFEICHRIQVGYSSNYFADFTSRCDELFSTARGIEDMKNIYYQKYFSLTSQDVKLFLAKYGDDIDSVMEYDEDLEVISVLKLFEMIEETNDVNYLKQLYENQNYYMTAEEMLHFDSTLQLMFANTYVESLSNTSNNIINSANYVNVEYNGKTVKLIEAGSEFSFIVHSNGTGFVTDKTTLAGNNYRTDWYQIANPTTHGLSTSYITDSNVGCCPVQGAGVLYGFTNIAASDIAIMAPYDVNSHIADYGFGSGNKPKYISADNMSSNTFRVYNEIVLNRASVKPDCVIIYDNSTQEQINNAYKAAADWDIPVVRINKTQLAQQQVLKIDNLIEMFRSTGDISVLEECVNLYESNVSGYKLNSYVEDGKTDATSSINNDNVANLFSPEKIELAIKEFLDGVKSYAEIDLIIELLENIKYKYEVVNTNGTKLVANTSSGINIDYLISYANNLKSSVIPNDVNLVTETNDTVQTMEDNIGSVNNKLDSLLNSHGIDRRNLVMYAATCNINHIPSEYRSVIEGISLADIKIYLNPDKANIGVQFFGGITNTSSQTVSDNTLKNDIWAIIKGHDAKHGQGDAIYRLNHVINPNDSNYGRYEVISSNGNARSILQKYTPEQISHGLSLIGFNNVSNASVSTNNRTTSSSNYDSVNNQHEIQNDIKNLMDLHNQIVGSRVNYTAEQGLMHFINPYSRNYGRYEVISKNGGARSILQKYTPAQIAAILQSMGYDVGNVPVDNSIFNTNNTVSYNVNGAEYMSSITSEQINDNLNSVVSNFMNGRKGGNSAYNSLITANCVPKRAPSTGRFEAFKNRFYNMTVEQGGFNHIRSKIGIEKSIEHRLYINADMDVTYNFLELFANKCEQRGIDYYFKTATNPSGSFLTRSESAVIYASEEMIAQYTQICQEIKTEHPEMSFYSPPVATSSIDGWLGYGAEPTSYTKQKLATEGFDIKKISFNVVRAFIIDKVIDNSITSFVNKFGNSVIFDGKTTNQLYIDSLYFSIKNSYKITDSNQQQQLYNYLIQNSDYFLNCLLNGGSFMVGGYTANVKTTNAYMYDYVGNYSEYYTFMEQEIKNISYEYGVDPNNFAINLYN